MAWYAASAGEPVAGGTWEASRGETTATHSAETTGSACVVGRPVSPTALRSRIRENSGNPGRLGEPNSHEFGYEWQNVRAVVLGAPKRMRFLLTAVLVRRTILPILQPDGCFPLSDPPPRGGSPSNQSTHPPYAPPRRSASKWSEPLIVVLGSLGTSVRFVESVMQPAPRSPYPSESTLQDQLSTALREHQSGRLEQAARIYQGILAQQSDHVDALHLLGVVALQQGQPAAGGRTDRPGDRPQSRAWPPSTATWPKPTARWASWSGRQAAAEPRCGSSPTTPRRPITSAWPCWPRGIGRRPRPVSQGRFG